MKSLSADPCEWNSIIATLPGAHILQTWQWGQVKLLNGWQPSQRIWTDDHNNIKAAALILKKNIPIRGLAYRGSILYIPRGPLMDWADGTLRTRVLTDLHILAKKEAAILIKIDPEILIGTGIPDTPGSHESPLGAACLSSLEKAGWQFSSDQIQFRNTVQLDLGGSLENWLQRMHPKTRYNLRLAQKKGVVVRKGSLFDLPLLYQMYAETSVRDGFVIRPEGYYQAVWTSFINAGMAQPLIAEVGGEPVAGLILFWFAQRAWYLYGMSRATHREKMPNYLLQWEAMLTARENGCLTYDLWGAPDEFNDQDSMWGVFRFKLGLGGTVIRTTGAWDFPSGGCLYGLYTHTLPSILKVMRRIGKNKTRQEIMG